MFSYFLIDSEAGETVETEEEETILSLLEIGKEKIDEPELSVVLPAFFAPKRNHANKMANTKIKAIIESFSIRENIKCL